jgi:hypothetical protein
VPKLCQNAEIVLAVLAVLVYDHICDAVIEVESFAGNYDFISTLFIYVIFNSAHSFLILI